MMWFRLFIKVLTVFYMSQSQAEVKVNCGENVDLSCQCRDTSTFRALTWYKLLGDHRRNFLIRISDGREEKDDRDSPATFGQNNSLHLPVVHSSDSGTYRCAITAVVNRPNKNCDVILLVHDCKTKAPTTTVALLDTLSSSVNLTQQEEELPLMWSIVGYLVVVFAKVFVTCTSIREGRCLYVVVLMATFWCSEALPLAVTAMLPICLFPTLGIIPSKKLCPQYFLETNFLFLSGLVMASSIEEWGLHRRIALKVLSIAGVKPAWLILGMMMTSSFLSMWLSNTATTAMMLPIANAILESLFGDLESLKQKCKSIKDRDDGIAIGQSNRMDSLPSVSSEKQILSLDGMDAVERNDSRTAEEIRSESEYQMRVWKGFLICIPYAASIGGTATLTGTAPNLILIGQLKSYFPECDLINFGSWFAFAFPLMLFFLLLGWLWIAFIHGGLNTRLCLKKRDQRADQEAQARAVIEEDYRKLGPLNFAEGAISFFFVLYAVLLFTRDPKFFTGWSALFKKGYVSDAVTGVIIVSILFFFPSQKPSLSWWLDPKASNVPYVPLLSWKKAQEAVPWNIILLLGGGFAMAQACEESGLASWIGGHLQPLAKVPPAVAMMLITAFVACFTEFASNTATIIIFLPVIAELAFHVSVNPLYFMIPATIGSSYAFMLPVSTPPNSIAFASGHLMVKDMVKTGIVMNILGLLSVSLAINTWGLAMFNLDTYPDWARPLNQTVVLMPNVTL
ncbi:solute carrier family 13 member 3 isoform X2 [Corythoichthys intestinalis]|uniref:solute carrier family 13 member 3 isoform X2 n=1 Tax=Corythoichthys intestinalis TaxID=161448 RepID=UPI0025A617EE|nr:solute carrier family 13 member 3 isoform X2 [Corythoichthys intestinalis]